MSKTKIEWSQMVWNPITGCTKVSTGCKHCYAERLFPRTYSKDRVIVPTPADGIIPEDYIQPEEATGHWTRPRKFTDVKLHPERLEQPLHWKKPQMIFVNSMSDLFHEDVPFEFIDQIFAAMAISKQHTFQILTKRPKRMLEWFNFKDISWKLEEMQGDNRIRYQVYHTFGKDNPTSEWEWPLKNVWLGISCENQETADERIPILLQVPAAVRFLSCEPLLDRINFNDVPAVHDPECDCNPEFMCASIPGRWCAICGHAASQHNKDGSNCCAASCDDHEWLEGVRDIGVDQIIVGGESGPRYRPMNLDWARDIRDQCLASGVPFFFKQTAGKKEIPEDLQIREYPHAN